MDLIKVQHNKKYATATVTVSIRKTEYRGYVEITGRWERFGARALKLTILPAYRLDSILANPPCYKYQNFVLVFKGFIKPTKCPMRDKINYNCYNGLFRDGI